MVGYNLPMTVFTEIVMSVDEVRIQHEPNLYGLQANAGFLLDQYLSNSGDLRHNFNKFSQ